MHIAALYHWSPRARRAAIIRRGLLPKQAPVVTGFAHLNDPDEDDDGWRQPVICLSSAPSTAWGLSGGMVARKGETWDLWQIQLADTDAVTIVPTWGPLIQEFRVANRIPKSRCWWVAERTV